MDGSTHTTRDATTPAVKIDTDGDGSASDCEAQGAVEVVFETDSGYRRKSSLVTDTIHPSMQGDGTSCFVHSLIEQQKQKKTPSPSPEGEKQGRRVDKANRTESSTHSRLLTKRQLSDMAFGIRELSKKLAHIRLKMNIRSIFLLTKLYDESLVAKTRDVTKWLLSSKENRTCSVYVENIFEANESFDAQGIIKEIPSAASRLKYWTAELCRKKPHEFDIIISLGGDGSVLYVSWLFQRVVPPVMAFSLGSLGFLTKFDYEGYRGTLTRVVNEGITVSLRLRFESTVMRSQRRERPGTRDLVEELVGEEQDDDHTHKPESTHNILNEVVVDRGPSATMSQLELFGDHKHFTTVQADGVCIATPTGSTAYNLAAGGSLSHPDNPVILVTAICAHTLSFRPIILPDTIVLRVGVPYDARTSSWASFDGRERVELHPGDYVTISASRYPFPCVLPPETEGEDWIESISRTLSWNSRQRQKAYKEIK